MDFKMITKSNNLNNLPTTLFQPNPIGKNAIDNFNATGSFDNQLTFDQLYDFRQSDF
jgi:hypothetical protein